MELLDLGHDVLVLVLSKLDAKSVTNASRAHKGLLRAASDPRLWSGSSSGVRLKGAVAVLLAQCLRVPPQAFAGRVQIDLNSRFHISVQMDRLAELLELCNILSAESSGKGEVEETKNVDAWLLSLVSNPMVELLAREAEAARAPERGNGPAKLAAHVVEKEEGLVLCARPERGFLRLRMKPTWLILNSPSPFSGVALPSGEEFQQILSSQNGRLDGCCDDFDAMRRKCVSDSLASIASHDVDTARGNLRRVTCRKQGKIWIGNASCQIPAGEVRSMAPSAAIALALLTVPRRTSMCWDSREKARKEVRNSYDALLCWRDCVYASRESEDDAGGDDEVGMEAAEVAIRLDMLREAVDKSMEELDAHFIALGVQQLAHSVSAARRSKCGLPTWLCSEAARAFRACFRLMGLYGQS